MDAAVNVKSGETRLKKSIQEKKKKKLYSMQLPGPDGSLEAGLVSGIVLKTVFIYLANMARSIYG